MRIRFIIIITLVLMVSIGCLEKMTEKPSEKGSSDWVEYVKATDRFNVLYNKERVLYGAEGTVQVWSKIVYSEEGRDKYIQSRKMKGLSTEGWDKLSFLQSLVEIDCNKQMYRTLSEVFYSNDNSVLDSSSFAERKWDYIPPGSILDTLRKKVCNNQQS